MGGLEVIMNEMSEKYRRALYSTHIIERSEEFILPDSFPDVKSLISCKARIADTKCYLGSTESEMTFCIIYNLLFSATKGEGGITLCSVSFKDEFKENIKYKFDNNVGVSIKNELTQCNSRMANPRKFAIKTLIRSNVFETVEENVYPIAEGEVPQDADIQYLLEDKDVLNCKSVVLSEHSFSDNVDIETRSAEINELVQWDAELFINEEKRADKDNPVKLKGIFALSCIYSDSEGKYRKFSKDIPFGITLNDDEKAVLSDVDAYSFVYPTANISAMNLNIGKNQYGENKVLEFDADYDIDILMLGNRKVSLVRDAYSVDYSCDTDFVRSKLLSVDGNSKTNLTCSDIAELPSGSDLCECINVQSSVEEICNSNDGKLSGKLKSKIAVMSEGDGLIMRETVSPFVCRADGLNGDDLVGSVHAASSKSHLDGDKLYIDSELYFNLTSLSETDFTICRSISNLVPYTSKSNSVFSIYFQTSKDSLWDTAKLKKTTVDRIKLSNPDYDSRYASALIIE